MALLGAPTNTTAGLDRLDGFVEGLSESGRTLDPALRIDGDFSAQSGYDAMRGLIRHRPDAVFVASDTMAIGALRAMRETGLEAPGDIAVVGFDDFAPAVMPTPWLTTVRQPVIATAQRAVQLLTSLIRGEVTPPVSEIIPVELVVRASCGAPDDAPGTEGD
jgi:LacI family transcriptional regulator